MPSLPSIPDQFRLQGSWCERLGSPLYKHLLTCCAEDYEKGRALYALLLPFEKDAAGSLLPLRLMGAVHRMVLEGSAPELARFYPSVGGIVALDEAWRALSRLADEKTKSLQVLIGNPVQTNDVGRSGSLLGGFGLIAQRTRLPLRLLEIGASAGLNLRWDRYRYEWSGGGWGATDSAVCLNNVFAGAAPSIPANIEIIERTGCDVLPVDVHSDDGFATLLSYTWADQTERIERLKSAVTIARQVPCNVDKAHAADWLEEKLQKPFIGAVTIVSHSVVWNYILKPEQERIRSIMQDAGSRASEEAPLAWLRMEPNEDRFEIRLQVYPGLETGLIATSHAHTPSVQWLLPASESSS